MNSKEGFERLGVGLCEAGVFVVLHILHTLLIVSMDLGCGGCRCYDTVSQNVSPTRQPLRS